jgi:hypothetical protein
MTVNREISPRAAKIQNDVIKPILSNSQQPSAITGKERPLPSEGKGQRFESSRARHPIPEQKAPFRMLFPVEIVAAFLAKLAAKFPAQPVAKIAIALCLAGVTAGNAAETVPIKRASPEAFRPSIVKDAVEAADWMAKSLADWGYKADFSLDSLKDVDRFIDEEAPDGKPKPGGHLAQQFGAHIFGLGAYLGETIRRQGDGQWEGNDRDTWPEVTLAVRLKSGTVLWPTQRVLKRLENGAENGLYPYGVVILRE